MLSGLVFRMLKHLPNIIALILIYVAAYFGWSWIWGLMFIIWVFPSFYSGEIRLINTVNREETPFLFWPILMTWLGMSLYLIAIDLIPLTSKFL